MKSSRVIAWGSIAVAGIISLFTLLIPPPPNQSIPLESFRITVMLSVPIAVLHVEAAGLFLWGLRGFKQQLRVAYAVICAGIVLLGVAQLQTPLVSFYDLTTSWWVSSGLVVIPFVAPVLLLFAGSRRFAHLFDFKTRWTSWWYVVGLSLLVSAAAVLLAWAVRGSDVQLLASVGLATWASAFLSSTATIMLRVDARAGQFYHSALRWFAAGSYVSALTGLAYVGSLVLFGTQNQFSRDGGTLVPDLIAGILFVRAGYAFKRINEQAVAQAEQAEDVTILDVIQFAALQASSPTQIDPILDRMRSVTATLPAGEKPVLTSEQQAELQKTYSDIEQYLVTKEQLRQFTEVDVRRRVAQNFGLNDQQLSQILGT